MKYITCFLVSLTSAFASAQMDASSRNSLIEKLRTVRADLPITDESRVPVSLRLADLLSERARLDSMLESQNGCNGECNAGTKDRKEAVELYKSTLDKLSADKRPKVLIQMGHVYQLLGLSDEALKYYVLANKSGDPAFKVESDLSIGELYFRQRQFSKAEPYFKSVLEDPASNSKGLASYRLAWCWYNLGQIQKGKAQLVTMLKTPNLLSRQAGSTQIDAQFAEEVSIDLAIFMAQIPFSNEDLKSLQDLSPENFKLSNLVSVAMEASRIGKRHESLLAWNFVSDQLQAPLQKYGALAHMAQLYLDLSDYTKSLDHFKRAIGVRSQIQVCEGNCAESDLRLKGMLISWNKIEKARPSLLLAEAYRAFESQFKDPEVNFWSLGVHRTLKNWEAAWSSGNAAMAGYLSDKKNLEVVLLTRLELSELAKNDEWLSIAQNDYINKSIEKSKISEVRYQRAQFLYDHGKYLEAANAMRELAVDKSVSEQLRIQAAHTSLDALVLAKSEEEILDWSIEYSSALGPKTTKDFIAIHQKAVLNKSAKLSEVDVEKAYLILDKFEFETASPQDKITYLKNRLILAEKTKRTSEGLKWADQLAQIKDISGDDLEFALGKKVYFSDLNLNFSESLKALEKMRMSQLAPEQKLLKLALYSQLAGQSAEKYLRAYLALSGKATNKAEISLELVTQAKEPLKEIMNLKKHLNSSPDVLVQAYSYAYGKDPVGTEKVILTDKVVSHSGLYKRLLRAKGISEYYDVKEKLEKANLDSSSQKTLTKSIKTRGQLLASLEAKANRDIQSKDWILQVLSLSLVAKESNRFYQELLSLPMPEGLGEEEQGQYMNLLSQQAGPYQQKAQAAQAKVSEFWVQSDWQVGLKAALSDESQVGLVQRQLIISEVKALSEIADEKMQALLSSLKSEGSINNPGAQPSTHALAEARDLVRKEPFNQVAIKNLLAIERQSKNLPMVQFLEGRLNERPGEVL